MDVTVVRPTLDPGLTSRGAATSSASVQTDLPEGQAVASLAPADRIRRQPRRDHGLAATRRASLAATILDGATVGEVTEAGESEADVTVSLQPSQLRAYTAPRQDPPPLFSSET